MVYQKKEYQAREQDASTAIPHNKHKEYQAREQDAPTAMLHNKHNDNARLLQ
ncbi:hypothetical protein [Okeania sp. KiyG1]|uniref:hypothetical protein n=1 Tax=Okeania sp. KiyG1 TaxID=2720165 RepID=UPI001923D372|nr:hypothetical protein [Okeania sp. KiyG1]GGA52838.1 hypothetical protein CYANOKiyG1_72780 [Okeania sp. KiyG1]